MKKIYAVFLFTCLLSASPLWAADEYAQCLNLNYKTNDGLIKCANEETNRIMSELDKRYGIVANHNFFRPWNDSSHTFADLKAAWLKYRNDYCNLLGYSQTHAKDDFGRVSEARCKLRETQHFRDDIEVLVKNYQKTLKK